MFGFLRPSPRAARKKAPARSAPRLEPLEDRCLMAGNVTASVSGKTLFLTGDGLPNALFVSTVGPRQIQVTGTFDRDLGLETSVNGVPGGALTFTVKHLRIALGDGDDDAWLRDVAIAGKVSFDGGAGSNTFQVFTEAQPVNTIRGSLKVVTYEGFDEVQLLQTHIFGKLSIATGASADVVLFEGVGVGGRVKVATGLGDDFAFIDDSFFGGPFALADDGGADEVSVEQRATPGVTQFRGSTKFRLGSEDDELRLGVAGDPDQRVLFRGNTSLEGGLGANTVNSPGGNFDRPGRRFRFTIRDFTPV